MTWRPASSQPSFATDFAAAGSAGMFRQGHGDALYQSNFNNTPQPFPGCQQTVSCHPNPSGVQSFEQPYYSNPHHPYPQPFVPPIVNPVSQHQEIQQMQSHPHVAKRFDPREHVEMDDDFPSYKDLRNVFLAKQNGAERESEISKPAHAWRSSRSMVQNGPLASPRKPPPTPKRKPSLPPTPRSCDSTIQSYPGNPNEQRNGWNPNTGPYEQSMENSGQIQPKGEGKRVRILSRHALAMSSNNSRHNSATERNIPIEVDQRDARPSNLQYSQTQVYANSIPYGRQRRTSGGGIHVNVTSPGSRNPWSSGQNSPRVVVTSNSPRSPQVARYRPDEEEYWQPQNITPRRASVTAMSPGISVLNSPGDQPRRRTSYAEIKLSSNSLPRNFRRNVSVDTSPPEVNSFDFFSQRTRMPVAVSNQTDWNQAQGDVFTRNKNQGWSATFNADPRQHLVQGGANVSYSPTTQGPRAVHAQYNTPIGLYSKDNAQQALDEAVTPGSEAANTIKITGSRSTPKPPSATLKAVLREDYVRKMTGAKPSVNFYRENHEYGPGVGPLRQYVEDIIG